MCRLTSISAIVVFLIVGLAAPASADRRQAVPRMPSTFDGLMYGWAPSNPYRGQIGVAMNESLLIVEQGYRGMESARLRFIVQDARFMGGYWQVPYGGGGYFPFADGYGNFLPGISPTMRVVGAGVSGAIIGGHFGGRKGALIGGIAAGGIAVIIERQAARRDGRFGEVPEGVVPNREVHFTRDGPKYEWAVKNNTMLVGQFILAGESYVVEPWSSVKIPRPDDGFDDASFIQPVVGGLRRQPARVVPTLEGTSWELVPIVQGGQ